MKARTLPHSIEAEQSLLGCVLINDADTQFEILDICKPSDFYSTAHQHIFKTMKMLYEKSINVDFVTLVQKLEGQDKLSDVGGLNYLTTLSNFVPSSANYSFYLDIVKNQSKQRGLIRTSEKLIEKAYEVDGKEAVDELMQTAEKAIYELGAENVKGGLELPDFDEIIEDYNKRLLNPDHNLGLKTGFYSLDKIIKGLKKGNLIILAGRPAMGKSALGMNIATNVALDGAKVAVFSLEMPKKDLAIRSVLGLAKISNEKYDGLKLNEKEMFAFKNANARLKEAKMYVDDNSLNTTVSILSKCRKLKREQGLDLIMVDYLQLMSGSRKNENRQQEISEISRMLKIIAKELDVPVLALSQLSRAVEGRSNKRPLLQDLRESGAIEQDADIVAFLYREDYYKEMSGEKYTADGLAEVIIAKNRNSALATALLKFTPDYILFSNLDKDSNMANLEEIHEQIDIF